MGKVKRRRVNGCPFKKNCKPRGGKRGYFCRITNSEGLINIVRFILCVIWSILLITLSLIIYVFTFRSAIPVSMARNYWAPGILKIYGIRLRVTGTEHLNKDRSYVFVCNHQSFLDIPILFYTIPVNLYFVAKKELKLVPFLGWYMIATGMIFIDRSNRVKSIASLNKAARLIHDGKNVLMFPEGTRNASETLQAFKKGPFMLARSAKVEVVPVGIDAGYGPEPSFRTGHKTLSINLGIPLESDGYALTDLILLAQHEVSVLSGKGSDSRRSARVANG